MKKLAKPDHNLLGKVVDILRHARTKVVREINKTQVLAYWAIGREIVEFEQKGKAREKYGEQLIERLSEDMTRKFGRGFSEINLRNMRRFYLEFPTRIQQTLSGESKKYQTVSGKSLESPKSKTLSRKSSIQQTLSDESVKKRKSKTLSWKSSIQQTLSAKFEPMLSWSKYCELLKVEEPLARSFYGGEEMGHGKWGRP
ncbi:MAG: DUF1016 N-terminal domain-containing protein [bacterium]